MLASAADASVSAAGRLVAGSPLGPAVRRVDLACCGLELRHIGGARSRSGRAAAAGSRGSGPLRRRSGARTGTAGAALRPAGTAAALLPGSCAGRTGRRSSGRRGSGRPGRSAAVTSILRMTSWTSSATALTLMLNWTSSCGWACHWKTCGALGLSTDKSLIYCAIVATCGVAVRVRRSRCPGLIGSWSAMLLRPSRMIVGCSRTLQMGAARCAGRLAAVRNCGAMASMARDGAHL